MNMEDKESIVTIGLPTYNGEKTIRRTIDSILAQTLRNFKLIISDDGSTDSTPEICQEYVQNDSRIEYIEKKEPHGWIWNFTSLVEKSNTKYFVWISHDDYWDPDFIEKNIEVLETNSKMVGSISKIELVGRNIGNYFPNQKEGKLKKIEVVFPIIGTYEEKIKKIIESNWILNLYSIFKTTELKKSIIHEVFVNWDFAVILNIIKFGDLHVLEDILAYRDTEGVTAKKSIISSIKTQKLGWFKTYFPYVRFTIWCIQNLGGKIFFKYNAYFRYLNFHSAKKIFRDMFNQKNLK